MYHRGWGPRLARQHNERAVGMKDTSTEPGLAGRGSPDRTQRAGYRSRQRHRRSYRPKAGLGGCRGQRARSDVNRTFTENPLNVTNHQLTPIRIP